MFVVNTLSQHSEEPRHVHLVATKHMLRYLKGTLDHGHWDRFDHEFGLYGYSDSDWADNIPHRKSTSGYCFSIGSNIVLWSSRKQSCAALSVTKAEYVATCVVSREAMWL
jgi:hypothetical protein